MRRQELGAVGQFAQDLLSDGVEQAAAIVHFAQTDLCPDRT